MRRYLLRDLPRELSELVLAAFPPAPDHLEVELCWLGTTDFPRLRRSDLASERVVVIISPRAWRLADAEREIQVAPLEPVMIVPAAVAGRRVPVPESGRQRMLAGAACVALFGLVVMVCSPREKHLLRAEAVPAAVLEAAEPPAPRPEAPAEIEAGKKPPSSLPARQR